MFNANAILKLTETLHDMQVLGNDQQLLPDRQTFQQGELFEVIVPHKKDCIVAITLWSISHKCFLAFLYHPAVETIFTSLTKANA